MSKTPSTRINEIRGEIDEIDSELLRLLAKRMTFVEQIGQIKADNKIPVVQNDRWEKLMKARLEQATQLGISKSLAQEFFELIAKFSVAAQKEISTQRGQ